ncbi:MAG: hypothetical protein ACRETP_00140 [Steroidobacteraceae bacterium]
MATAPGSGARAGERVPAPDAQQLAQRILSGAPDVPADRRVTSAVQESAAGRLRLAERRHDADVHQLIRRMILGQGV